MGTIQVYRAPREEVYVFTKQDEHDEHCIARLRERYGLVTAPWFLRQLERAARRGTTDIVGHTKTNGEVHRHEQDTRVIFFMTDVRSGSIVTVLDEPGATAMAVRRENARRGRREGRCRASRGPMADSLELIAPAVLSPDQLCDLRRLRGRDPSHPRSDVPTE